MAIPLLPILYATLQLAVLMAVGVALRRFAGFGDEFFRSVSRLVVTVALPLFFFVRMSRVDLGILVDAALMPAAAVMIIAIGLFVSVPLFALIRFSDSDRRAGVALSSFGNSGYIPLTMAEVLPSAVPVIAARYGSELPSVFIGAYLFAMSPLLWSIGNMVITSTGGGLRSMRLRNLISPPLIGIVAGLLVPVLGLQEAFANPNLPIAPIMAGAERLSAITVPLALVTLGGMIGGLIGRPKERLWQMAIVVTAVRLLLLPGIFYLAYFTILRPLGASAVAVFVIFLEMHTPPANNLSIMAGRAGVNREHTAFSLLVSYVVFVLAMPLLVSLYLLVVA